MKTLRPRMTYRLRNGSWIVCRSGTQENLWRPPEYVSDTIHRVSLTRHLTERVDRSPVAVRLAPRPQILYPADAVHRNA